MDLELVESCSQRPLIPKGRAGGTPVRIGAASSGIGALKGRHRSDDQTGAVGPLLLDPPARRDRLDNRHDELLAPSLVPQSPEGRDRSEKELCNIRDDEGGGVHHPTLLSALDGPMTGAPDSPPTPDACLRRIDGDKSATSETVKAQSRRAGRSLSRLGIRSGQGQVLGGELRLPDGEEAFAARFGQAARLVLPTEPQAVKATAGSASAVVAKVMPRQVAGLGVTV
jgi:hypothetical protein